MNLGMYTYTGGALTNGVAMDVMIEMFNREAKKNPNATLNDIKLAAVVQWDADVGPGRAEITHEDGSVDTIEVSSKGSKAKRAPLIELVAGDTLRVIPAENSPNGAKPFTMAVDAASQASIVPGLVDRPTLDSDPNPQDTPEQAAAREWLRSGKTGVSSKTLSHTLLGVPGKISRVDGPYDPADFARCMRLIEKIPSLRERMGEMASVPGWEALAPAWPELEALYQEERDQGSAPRLYARMSELRHPPKRSHKP